MLRSPILLVVLLLVLAGLVAPLQAQRARDKNRDSDRKKAKAQATTPAPAAVPQVQPTPAQALPAAQPAPDAEPELTEAEVQAMAARLDSLADTYQPFARYTHRLMLDASHPYAPTDSSVPQFAPDIVRERLAQLPSEVPLDYNPTVHRFIDAYTVRLRPLLTRLVGMQYVYFPLIEQIFEEEGVPTELKYLCVIESAFNNRARSRAAAVGLWQFMYGTAKLYGLRMDDYVDERQDPYKSTRAAARYLKHMYSTYRDWHLVIAAYNCGPGRINRAIRMSGGKRDYWKIIQLLPRETRGYVPSYIAATYALNYYAEHNIRPQWVDFAFEDSLHIVNQELALDDLAAATGADSQLLRDLNPALRLAKVPYSSKPFVLRVPASVKQFVQAHPDTISRIRSTTPARDAAAQLADAVPVNARKLRHTVRRGQTYAVIARAYRVSTEDLMRWNKASSANLEVGQVLTIYKAGTPVRTPVQTASSKSLATGSAYRVRRGDTLWGIAQKQGVTIDALRRANRLTRSSKIVPGQTLRIPR